MLDVTSEFCLLRGKAGREGELSWPVEEGEVRVRVDQALRVGLTYCRITAGEKEEGEMDYS